MLPSPLLKPFPLFKLAITMKSITDFNDAQEAIILIASIGGLFDNPNIVKAVSLKKRQGIAIELIKLTNALNYFSNLPEGDASTEEGKVYLLALVEKQLERIRAMNKKYED